MVKTTSETQTKTATKSANTRHRSSSGKRAPSAYNKYVASNMKVWREANPDRPVKEAMAAVAAQWREAPENPNRGQEPKKKGAKKGPAERELGATRSTRKTAAHQEASSDAEVAVASD